MERCPGYTPRQCEHLLGEENGAVFITGIGGDLNDDEPHDLYAVDSDNEIS